MITVGLVDNGPIRATADREANADRVGAYRRVSRVEANGKPFVSGETYLPRLTVFGCSSIPNAVSSDQSQIFRNAGSLGWSVRVVVTAMED